MKDVSTKSKVLDILSEAEVVSGEELAKRVGVSRNAIWKAVSSLRNLGYNIDAKSKLGYSLKRSNVLDIDGIRKYLSNPDYADKIELFETIDSTNTEAKRYAASHELSGGVEKIFVADKQTAGKGRRGRSFYSPKGSGIYVSFLLCPDMKAADAVSLTTLTSVAVCKAVEKVLGEKPVIKWVNDVYLGEKKICGILTEAVTDFETDSVSSVVIGAGVNVFETEFPDDIASVAGSLGVGSDSKVSRNRLLAEIINQMFELIVVEHDGKVKIVDYIDDYKERSMVIGKKIRILNTDEKAEAVDIDKNGGLVVKLENGAIKTLGSGEISIRLDYQ